MSLGQKDFGAKELYIIERRRCVNAKAFFIYHNICFLIIFYKDV